MAKNPPGASIQSKTGTAPIQKVGHTVGTKYGTNPMAKERGASNPTPVTYNS